MTRYDDSPADEVRRMMGRYPTSTARTAAALDAALGAPAREPTGTEIAAADLSGLMEDWSPQARRDALDALALDLAEGGSIAVSVIDDEEPWR